MNEGHRGGRRKIIAAILACIIVLAGAGVAVWFFAIQGTGPIPKKYTKGLNIQLYYPTRLPAGYTVDTQSFERQDDVLIFNINAPNGKNIAVAQQAIPADAPTHTKSNAPISLPGEKDFQTAIGQGHVGLWGDKYVADIITPKGTWIIINATGFTTDEATSVSQSFAEL